MNVLWRTNESREKFIPSIIDELRKKELIDNCVVVYQGTDRYDTSFCYEIPAYLGYHVRYQELCDEQILPPPHGELLKALVPYKDTIFNMTGRQFNEHLLFYDEMNEEYMRHVTFWNWILDTHKIDFCFFMTVPHCAWEYTIYALAKVKKIPTLIICGACIYCYSMVGTSIETLGNNVYSIYEKYKDMDLAMSDEVKLFYENVKEKEYGTPLKQTLFTEVLAKRWVKKSFYKHASIGFQDFIYLAGGIAKKHYMVRMSEIKKKREMQIRFRHKKRSYANLRYYNKIANKNCEYNADYIIYFLHYEPESSTLPMGGIWENQLCAIEMLADACKKRNIKLYVKEHPTQFARRKSFYEKLHNISNVFLISSLEDSYKLIDSAIATATVTGTCSYESIIRGIPSLRFQTFDLEGIPGIYNIQNADDVENAIEQICNNKCTIKPNEIEHYFSIYDKCHIIAYLDWNELDNGTIDTSKSRVDIINLLTSYINSGLAENFCYEQC